MNISHMLQRASFLFMVLSTNCLLAEVCLEQVLDKTPPSEWQGVISCKGPNALTVFDTGKNAVIAVVPLPTESLSAIISPDGKTIYTANSGRASVFVIDTATNTIINTIPTSAGLDAFDLIISPDGNCLYISNNSSGLVTVIDTVTQTEVTNIALSPNLGPLSITPDGTTVYASNFSLGNITPIDTATNTPGVSIDTGIFPGMISIMPDGTCAYVANFISNTVSIIDLTTNTVSGNIAFPVDANPYGLSILPNGTLMYVANIGNSTVSVVNLATNLIVTTIPLTPSSGPFKVVSTPDSKRVYVTSEFSDTCTPIDVATNIAGTPFVGMSGDMQDIVMSADQAPKAQFFAIVKPIGKASKFDASASCSPVGSIVKYHWDFGDGRTRITSLPFIKHVYRTVGDFTVTLTVTNSAGTSLLKVFSSRFMSNNGGPSATHSQRISIMNLEPRYRPRK